jgi:hypothetical protein
MVDMIACAWIRAGSCLGRGENAPVVSIVAVGKVAKIRAGPGVQGEINARFILAGS